MLPILRIIPVGGVFLAIVITVLALSPPDGARPHVMRVEAPSRGPLVDRESHPEWRQFFIQAALRRAGELERLRELPDTPSRSEPVPDLVEPSPVGAEAGLPPIGGPEALAMETAAERADTGAMQPEPSVATLPPTPVLAVEKRDLAALQKSTTADDRASEATAVQPEPAGVDTQVASAAQPDNHGNGASSQAPDTFPDDASAMPPTEPKADEVPLVDDAGLPIKDNNVAISLGSAVREHPSPAASDNQTAASAAVPMPQPEESNEESKRVVAPNSAESTASAEDEARSAGPPEEGSADAADTRKAALSAPTVVPRERPTQADDPRQKKRVVRGHARPVRTATNESVTPDFFENLLRMFSLNARPPSGPANTKRLHRSPY